MLVVGAGERCRDRSRRARPPRQPISAASGRDGKRRTRGARGTEPPEYRTGGTMIVRQMIREIESRWKMTHSGKIYFASGVSLSSDWCNECNSKHTCNCPIDRSTVLTETCQQRHDQTTGSTTSMTRAPRQKSRHTGGRSPPRGPASLRPEAPVRLRCHAGSTLRPLSARPGLPLSRGASPFAVPCGEYVAPVSPAQTAAPAARERRSA